MNELHKWRLRKPGPGLVFTIEVIELLSKPSHRRSLEICPGGWPWVWPVRGFLEHPVSSGPWSRLSLPKTQRDPSSLPWDRQLFNRKDRRKLCNFCFTVQPSAYHSANYDCQLGNGDVCPVETSWDHIWILKHRYFLLCKVRPSFFLGIFRPDAQIAFSLHPARYPA